MPVMISEENHGKSVAVWVSGKLVKADYEWLVPEIDRHIRPHGKLRLLFELTDFQGWETGALLDEVKFDLRHFADIERIAMIGDRKWEHGMEAFYKPFTKATTRYFDLADAPEAWAWWRAPAPAATAKAA